MNCRNKYIFPSLIGVIDILNISICFTVKGNITSGTYLFETRTLVLGGHIEVGVCGDFGSLGT